MQSPAERPTEGRPQKRPRTISGRNSNQDQHRPPVVESVAQTPPTPTTTTTTTTEQQSAILVGPAVAEDVEILQRHISKHDSSNPQPSNPYRLLSRDSSNPVIYLSVPRSRTGLQTSLYAGKGHLEIVSQILGPFKNEVIELYLKWFHSNYPVVDDSTCELLRNRDLDSISPSLLCTIYAAASPLWAKSDTLKLHPHPDYHYFWNKAISALYEDFISPSLATISSATVEAVGRPSVSIVGNIANCGRTVALAQSFGLHRDPSQWNIGAEEKTTRIRLWWGVLINDYWSSIAYGTPPHSIKGCFDVPLPVIESLLPAKATTSQRCSSICFLHLCSLTEILGDILPFVYQLKPEPQEMIRAVERLRCSLDDLRSKLPDWLPLPNQPGTSNLWFCFLYTRLLISRLSLRAAVLDGEATGTPSNNDRLAELCGTSTAVLDFIISLDESQFQDFWLPYCGHLLVLATMVALRCTVESDTDARSAHITRLQQFLSRIQFAHDHYEWDIADYCIERCAGPIAKLAALMTGDSQQAVENAVFSGGAENGNAQIAPTDEDQTGSFFLSDYLDSTASFDYSWEALWDTPSAISGFPL